jgi:hypothetical protein
MTPFELFQKTHECKGLVEALDELGGFFRSQKRYHELFELRKVVLRMRLDLPVDQWQSIEELPAGQAEQLETGLLEICRDVGSELMRDGEILSGWSYLEPVGDKRLARELLGNVTASSSNLEALIHLSIGQGIDPGRGFALVLERFGTCAAITTLESQLAAAPLETRRDVVAQLVRHVYQELSGNVDRSLGESRQTTDGPYAAGYLTGIMKRYPDLTAGLNHHIDTTHLASTVRCSRILCDPEVVGLAIELASYGCGLHADFQYPAAPPFESTYPDTREFLRAILGEDVDKLVPKLESLAQLQLEDSNILDSAAWLVYLLDQRGRGEEAVDAWLARLHEVNNESVLNDDMAPSLQQLTRRYRLWDKVAAVLRERGDLLGYSTVISSRAQVS